MAKLAELATLLAKTGSTPGESTNVVRSALEQLDPESRDTLTLAFGRELRRELLNVLLEACGDHAGASTGSKASTERITDKELTALVARLFRQFLGIESAVVEIAVEFTKGVHPRLPENVGDLKIYTLQLLRNGGDDSVERMNDYLGDINRWMVAILTAWADAPEEWWKEWWGKIKPESIESRAEVGWYSNRHRQYWSDFRELVRDLNPLEVKSQLLEVAAKIAIERHRKQKGGG